MQAWRENLPQDQTFRVNEAKEEWFNVWQKEWNILGKEKIFSQVILLAG